MNQTSMALVSPCCPFPMRRRLFVRPRFDEKDYWHWLHLLIDNSVKTEPNNPTKPQTLLPLPPFAPKIGNNIWLEHFTKTLLPGLQEVLCSVFGCRGAFLQCLNICQRDLHQTPATNSSTPSLVKSLNEHDVAKWKHASFLIRWRACDKKQWVVWYRNKVV